MPSSLHPKAGCKDSSRTQPQDNHPKYNMLLQMKQIIAFNLILHPANNNNIDPNMSGYTANIFIWIILHIRCDFFLFYCKIMCTFIISESTFSLLWKFLANACLPASVMDEVWAVGWMVLMLKRLEQSSSVNRKQLPQSLLSGRQKDTWQET